MVGTMKNRNLDDLFAIFDSQAAGAQAKLPRSAQAEVETEEEETDDNVVSIIRIPRRPLLRVASST